MKKILVTGGAGFVGSALCHELHNLGHDVYSLDNYFTGSKENHHQGVKYFEGHTRDISKIFENHTFDLVYHLGEYSRVEKSFEDPIGLVWDLNIAGTFSVLEFCKNKRCKLIYSGSSTKFASDGDGGNMSPYAWSKSSNTQAVKNYGDWFGLEYAITYFYNVYGPGEVSEGPYSTIIGIFDKQVKNSLPLTVVKPGDQKRNFTHVEDIVSALVVVGEKGKGDEYGIGSDEAYSIKEVASMFSENIIWMPERRGNRTGAIVMSEKTKSLGWEPKRSLPKYIESLVSGKANPETIRNRILVFATTFFPKQGLCEEALYELIKKVPDIHFDVITTSIGVSVDVVYPKNLSIYRVENKMKLFSQGEVIAKNLAKDNKYAFVWSVMASYGTYPAYKMKKYLKVPLLVSLGDQKISGILTPKYWIFRFLVRGGDQISTNAILERNISRKSNLSWLNSVNKKGDTFSNAFRFAYNMIFANIYKNQK